MWNEVDLKFDLNEEYDVKFAKVVERNRQMQTEALTYNNMSLREELRNLAEIIIKEALDYDTSDIKIYQYDAHNAFVELRINGEMVKVRRIHKDAIVALVQVFKRMAGIDVSEINSKKANDGRITMDVGNTTYTFRVNSMPSIFSETLSIRIIKSDNSFNDLGLLGLPEHVLNRLRAVLSQREGMLVLSGGTGSGKTTTMYTALKEIVRVHKGAKNIHTLEDPIESLISGTVQNEVNELDGFDYANGMRGLLRQNPDIILVGEVRDKDSALTATRAANSGHLLMTTVHTSNALQVPMVMQHYEVERNVIASSLLMVLNQRLVNRLCPHCRTDRIITTKDREFLARIGLDPNTLFSTGERSKEGCVECGYTGVKGKILVVEMLDADREFEEYLYTSENEEELRRKLVEAKSPSYYSREQDVLRLLGDMEIDFNTVMDIVR